MTMIFGTIKLHVQLGKPSFFPSSSFIWLTVTHDHRSCRGRHKLVEKPKACPYDLGDGG